MAVLTEESDSWKTDSWERESRAQIARVKVHLAVPQYSTHTSTWHEAATSSSVLHAWASSYCTSDRRGFTGLGGESDVMASLTDRDFRHWDHMMSCDTVQCHVMSFDVCMRSRGKNETLQHGIMSLQRSLVTMAIG